MRLKPAIVTALIFACSTAFADDALQPFMPYNVEPFVDTFGSRWDFREDGSVNDGTRGCFDGAFEYEIQQVRVRFMFQKQARMGMMRGNAGPAAFGTVAATRSSTALCRSKATPQRESSSRAT
jgi:hypothetical protein